MVAAWQTKLNQLLRTIAQDNAPIVAESSVADCGPQPLRLIIGDRVVIAGGLLEGKSGEVVRVAGDSVGVNLVGSRFRTSVRSIDLVRVD